MHLDFWKIILHMCTHVCDEINEEQPIKTFWKYTTSDLQTETTAYNTTNYPRTATNTNMNILNLKCTP